MSETNSTTPTYYSLIVGSCPQCGSPIYSPSIWYEASVAPPTYCTCECIKPLGALSAELSKSYGFRWGPPRQTPKLGEQVPPPPTSVPVDWSAVRQAGMTYRAKQHYEHHIDRWCGFFDAITEITSKG